jgi:hypothetical protein
VRQGAEGNVSQKFSHFAHDPSTQMTSQAASETHRRIATWHPDYKEAPLKDKINNVKLSNIIIF